MAGLIVCPSSISRTPHLLHESFEAASGADEEIVLAVE
jgi:hypothetical protein